MRGRAWRSAYRSAVRGVVPSSEVPLARPPTPTPRPLLPRHSPPDTPPGHSPGHSPGHPPGHPPATHPRHSPASLLAPPAARLRLLRVLARHNARSAQRSLGTTLARHNARSTQRSPGSSGSSLNTTLDWRRLPLHITLNTTPRSRERRRERARRRRLVNLVNPIARMRPIRRSLPCALHVVQWNPVAQYGALHVVQWIPSPNTAPFTWCSGSRRPRPPGEGLGTDGVSW